MKRQYITRGRYAAKVTTTVTPQERNRVAINFTIDEGDVGEDRADQHRRRQARSPRSELLDADDADDAGLDDVVHEERPVLEAEARAPTSRRCAASTRTAAISSSTSTRRRSRSRRTRKTSTSRSTSPKGRATRSPTSASPATCRCRAPSSRGSCSCGRATSFSRERLQATRQGDQRPPRHRGLRVRQRQRRSGDRPREAAGRVHDLRRSGPPRLHPQDQHHRQRAHARRGDPPRDAPARGRLVRRRADRALEGADQAARLFRRRQHRDAAGAGTTDQADVEVTVIEKATGSLLAGVGYSSAEKFVFNASISQQNIFGSGNALTAGDQHEHDQPHDLARVHRAVLHRRRHLAHARGLPAEHRSRRRSSVSQYTSSTCGAAVELRHPDHRDRHDQLRLPLRAHGPDAVRRTARRLLSTYVARVRHRRPTASSCPAAGRVTPATTSSILRRGRCRARWRRGGAALGDLSYYKLNYLVQNFWPIYGDFVLMLRGDVGYADGYGGKPLPFFKAFYAGGVGSVRGYEHGIARAAATSTATQPAASARSSAMPSSSIRSSRATSRCAPACSSTPARSTSTAMASRSQLYECRVPLLVRRRRSRGIRRSGRSSSATAFPLNDKPGDKIQHFQFQVGTVF